MSKRYQKEPEDRIKTLDNIIRRPYEGRVVGRISVERYDELAGGYEQEQVELKQELVQLSAKIDAMNVREDSIRRFIAEAKSYVDMEKLTPELLRVFIRRN